VRAAVRREQQEHLESNHSENQATWKEGKASHRHHKYRLLKRRNGSLLRLLRMNSLKEGTMWHVDLFLGNDHETSNYTTTVAR
jgi:hypothetical protein